MRLIVTRPQEDADALKTRLEALGHKVILSPLLEILPLADAVIRDAPYQLIALTGANGVLLFSPRTARIWVELIARSGLEAAARGMLHICISKNAGAALPETYPRQIAAQATEAAMLDVIASLGNRPLTSPQQ